MSGEEFNLVKKPFKDKYKDLQFLIKEMYILRSYNDKKAKDKKFDELFLFSEASALFICLERFLRVLPAIKASNSDTIYNLMERALKLFNSPYINITNERLTKVVTDIRNGILHGNFEKCAYEYKCDVEQYFGKGHFTQDIQIIFDVFRSFIDQVNSLTGEIILIKSR